LIGAKITGVSRRGKFLWLTFNRPFALVIHLGMSGQVHLPKTPAPRSTHLRALITFTSGKEELHFDDQRTFGYLAVEKLVADPYVNPETAEEIPQSITHIAPDLMEVCNNEIACYSCEDLSAKICTRKSEIKRVLLNQSVVSGVGNIYADEGLWAAKIHPETLAYALAPKEVLTLLKALHAIMVRAIKFGGASIDGQFKRVNGESGYFNVQLNAYRRAGEPCPRCGTLIQRLRFMNRSSHLCPTCQK
jgi:formamidopyrimidine-DNA glycosylase